jgi:hypothetical protein
VIPWQPPARGRRQWRKDMTTWIGNELDWRNEALVNDANAYWHGRTDDDEQFALGAARVGNIEPLRQLHPNIAEFIHLPKKGRRGKYPRRRDGVMPQIDMAVEDVKFVKMLWRELYGRRRGGDLSAEEVVADYHKAMGHTEVTEDAILERAKTLRVGAEQAAWDAARARKRALSIRG